MKRSLTLTLHTLLSLTLPLFAQHPRLESDPPSLLSASPVYGPTPGAQWMGQLVPTGDGWIAVWADQTVQECDSNAYRLMATRMFTQARWRQSSHRYSFVS